MQYQQRIRNDIDLLSQNLIKIEAIDFTAPEKEILKRAENYRDDAWYYLDKEDYITSFGCITYAHGLIDSLRIIHGQI